MIAEPDSRHEPLLTCSCFFYLLSFIINKIFQRKTLVMKLMNVGGRAGRRQQFVSRA